MQATTIKIENPLLNQLKGCKPKDISLSAFIRELLESQVRKQKMAVAAQKYTEFLQENPDEEAWLTEWEKAPLDQPPKARRRKKGRL